MVRIRFIRQGSNSAIGGFSHGDTLTCGEALAAHLVNEARVAEYVQSPQGKEPPIAKPATRRGSKKG